MAQQWYRAVLHLGESGSVGVVFPDLPGCVSVGESESEALTRAREALALHLEGMLADGESAPVPSRLEDELPDWIDPPAAVALVPVDLPGKSVRVNITLDEGLLARVDRAATERGLSRSALLAESARALIAAR